jgi:Zn-dependent protease
VLPTHQGSFRLFQVAGITVFLHWSWFLVAFYGISQRSGAYSSIVWNVAEYLALFLIVLLHEFGHSLACRQVGGRADQIVLWPLGGVAYVAPPHRPGATLWSIAAGPLVNVGLFPVLSIALVLGRSMGMPQDLDTLALSLWFINCVLLVFNLLPIYPLDGGQILRSLLWFIVSCLIAGVGCCRHARWLAWRRHPAMRTMPARVAAALRPKAISGTAENVRSRSICSQTGGSVHIAAPLMPPILAWNAVRCAPWSNG